MAKRTKQLVVMDEDGGPLPPPPATTAPTGWGDLPNEMLTKIFKELKIDVDENGKAEFEEEKQALLNCRLMNRRWRDVTDDVLEKQCIDFWKGWRPHLKQRETTGYPHCFAVLHFESTSAAASIGSAQIHCPPLLKTKMKMLEKSPSPTNSVCVTQKPTGRVAQPSHKNWTLLGLDVFAKFGQHLTSITFFSIDRIGILAFSRILSHTPNLQGLALQRIKIPVLRPDRWKFTLPPLPNLAHLKLMEVDWLGRSHSREYSLDEDLSRRILEDYKSQLETLEIDFYVWYEDDDVYEYDLYDDMVNFAILKTFKFFMKQFSDETPQLPTAGHVCLVDLAAYYLLDYTQKPHLLDSSGTTIVQLHIRFDPDRYDSPNGDVDYSDSDDGDDTLPNLKILAITYPKCAKGLEAVTGFLKVLPNLEELKFIQFNETDEDRESTEDDNETVRNHLVEMQYWTVCNKLKAISASMGADDSKPFYIRLKRRYLQ